MATYYVNPVDGNDANNGLGPDASAVTNKPWKTIGKLLGASGMASGDTAYLSPGVYRQQVTVAMTAATVTTSIIGDPTNAQGFKTAAGVLVAAGDVRHTAYITNDKTAPAANTTTLNLAGRTFLSFQNIVWVGNTKTVSGDDTAGSHDLTFTNCVWLPGSSVGGRHFTFTGTADTASNITFDRCFFLGYSVAGTILITLPTSVTADYDSVIVIKNCVFRGASSQVIRVLSTGGGGFKAGGVIAYNCDAIGVGDFFQTGSANLSTTIPCKVYDCKIFGVNSTALNANTSGQIVEDYNVIEATTPRSNVTAGTHSISDGSYSLLVEIGQDIIGQRVRRPYGMPTADSPLLNFGSQAGAPTVDILGRPRPAGGKGTSYAVGALERHDTAIQGGAANADDGINCWQQDGPMDDYLPVLVDAVATVLSIKQKTNNYVGTNYPQVVLLANAAIGVTTQTVADTSAHTSYTKLTLASFTPTAKGVVILQLQNLTGDGAGQVFWDSLNKP